jgi:glutamate synthase domain-containing protein 3
MEIQALAPEALATPMHFQTLNRQIKESSEDVIIHNCLGQRYIAAGLSSKNVTIHGTPGNALGAYMDGANVTVYGNAQDAVGDTMNDGRILIHGNAGDTLGYGARGGRIYVRGNSGYRTGIHIKQYKDKSPVIVVGGVTGSFLAEYQAGGLIIVLNLENEPVITGRFAGTGMHGGRVFLRTDHIPIGLPSQVRANESTPEELDSIRDILSDYCAQFGLNVTNILYAKFLTLTPNSDNPYHQLYTPN